MLLESAEAVLGVFGFNRFMDLIIIKTPIVGGTNYMNSGREILKQPRHIHNLPEYRCNSYLFFGVVRRMILYIAPAILKYNAYSKQEKIYHLVRGL
jgi:hypothetical protein